MKTHFHIDSRTLREKTDYAADSDTYEYRPRGMYDTGGESEPPYPEVVDFAEQEDGTIMLTVNAVWPERGMARAFTHQVTVRPLPDGGFAYVSNKVISFGEDVSAEWYVNRLTKEEWERYYGTVK